MVHVEDPRRMSARGVNTELTWRREDDVANATRLRNAKVRRVIETKTTIREGDMTSVRRGEGHVTRIRRGEGHVTRVRRGEGHVTSVRRGERTSTRVNSNGAVWTK